MWSTISKCSQPQTRTNPVAGRLARGSILASVGSVDDQTLEGAFINNISIDEGRNIPNLESKLHAFCGQRRRSGREKCKSYVDVTCGRFPKVIKGLNDVDDPLYIYVECGLRLTDRLAHYYCKTDGDFDSPTD